MTEQDYSNIDVDSIEVNYTKEDVEKAASRPVLKTGWYMGLCKGCKKMVSKKNGHLMLNITCAPMSDPSDAKSVGGPFASGFQLLPFPNPHIEGHAPPESAGNMIIPVMQAFFPDEVPRIRKDKESGVYMLHYGSDKGKEIDPEKLKETQNLVAEKALEKALAVWNDPSIIIRDDFGVYFKTKRDGDFVGIDMFRQELPPGAEIITQDWTEYL